jgi:nucleoside-diphosphate-sugar epimerase
MSKGALLNLLQGCGGFIHVASNMSWSADPNVVVTETVNAATNAVKSAANEPNIKRFLYTSSSAATTLTHPNETRTIDENSWNEEAIKLAYGPNPEPYHVYCASKRQAERAIWKWVEDNKPGFVVNAGKEKDLI